MLSRAWGQQAGHGHAYKQRRNVLLRAWGQQAGHGHAYKQRRDVLSRAWGQQAVHGHACQQTSVHDPLLSYKLLAHAPYTRVRMRCLVRRLST